MKHFLIQKSNSQVLVESTIDGHLGEPIVRESDLYFNVTANRLTSALAAVSLHTRNVRIEARFVNAMGKVDSSFYSDPFERWERLGFPALPHTADSVLIREVPA